MWVSLYARIHSREILHFEVSYQIFKPISRAHTTLSLSRLCSSLVSGNSSPHTKITLIMSSRSNLIINAEDDRDVTAFDLGVFSTPTARTGIIDTLIKDGRILSQKFKQAIDESTYGGTTCADVEKGTNTGSTESTAKLGTLTGVFLPCLQNILGVILFIRLPFITSQAGCIQTTLIILMCVTSTFLTALSLSAIATNGTIQAGGPYYVISRNLGVEIGGALGLLFYLGTTIASSMYVLGAIEAIQTGFDLSDKFTFDTQVMALALMFLIASIVSVGVKYVNMGAFVFLGVVLVSIFCLTSGVSLFAADVFDGKLSNDDRIFGDNINSNYTEDPDTKQIPNFFSLLALFYPSVTGIMAGSNRSSVLSNPGKSIPTGTIGAIMTTTLIYISVVWLFGSFVSNEALKADKLIVTAVTFPHELIVKIGIIMSSIGAALQCVAGAPRLLAAIAMDETIPFLRPFMPASPTAEPKRAVWLTWFIASLPTLAGNLDFITPIITMFFLLMYAGCNISCFFLSIVKTPNFRPTFKYFHWSTSLFGFIWCIGLALVISWYTAIVAISLCVILYGYIKSQGAVRDWGDVTQGFLYNVASHALTALEDSDDFHAKNWRPQILTILDIDEDGYPCEKHLLSLAAQLKKGNGLNMLLSIVEGSILDPKVNAQIHRATMVLKNEAENQDMHGYVSILPSASNAEETILTAIQNNGLGKLNANTVLMSFPNNWKEGKNAGSFVSMLIGVTNTKKAILLFKGSDSFPDARNIQKEGTIDIWWIVFDGGLLLLIPFLLSKSKTWKRGATLRLFAVITEPTENKNDLETAIHEHLKSVRISASVTIIDLSSTEISIATAMRDDQPEDRCEAESPKSNVTMVEIMLSPKKTKEIRMIKDRTVEEVFAEIASPSKRKIDSKSRLTAATEEPHESRMRAATTFNNALKMNSSSSKLVVLNLPLMRSFNNPEEYMNYTEKLCDGIENVLLVRGSGAEVITTCG